MTDPDYPAAHSMDTIWYAVDEAGHVAALMTGEGGSVPDAAGSPRLIRDLYARTFNTHPDDYLDWERAATALGVHLYGYNEEMPLEYVEDRYRRELVAARPLHVDQLPPDLRREWKLVRFPGVRFANAEYLQPYEFFPCTSYDVEAVAYLGADGTTIRPIRGREDVFAEAVEEWREDQPEAAAQYRFEGTDDGR